MPSQEFNALRKEVKKKLIDRDLDYPGFYKDLVPRLSDHMGRSVNRNSLSMALSGFRNGKSSREILEALDGLLDSWNSM
jgi:hypothetical protein